MNINKLLEKEALKHSCLFRSVSVDFLEYMKQDFYEVAEDLDDFKETGIYKYFDFNIPKLDFEVKSIIVAANDSYSYANLYFNYKGKIKQLKTPGPYMKKAHSSQTFLEEVLNDNGYHLEPTFAVPHKLLAVKSGLAKYGRNNVTYVDGMGSFITLDVYYSDMPSTVQTPFELDRMDSCDKCKACTLKCAGGAISATRKLIDSNKCITRYNESGTDDFPPHIDICVQDCIYGCINCQLYCRANRPFVKNIAPDCEFSEEETNMLLDGISYDELPTILQEKLDFYNISDYMTPLPRNLKLLLNRE